MTARTGRDGWDGSAPGSRRAPLPVLDSVDNGVHSALVPPGALHHRVTAALSNWQLDDAEELLADVGTDSSPYVAPAPRDGSADRPTDLGRAWADTLRAELLVRRLRVAGFTLVGDPVTSDASDEEALDLHAGVADLIEGAGGSGHGAEADPRSESASRAALAIALVRSAKAAFDATDDDLQRAAADVPLGPEEVDALFRPCRSDDDVVAVGRALAELTERSA